MPPRSLTLGLLAAAALLGPLAPARAADLDENYGYAEAPQEVPVVQSKVEFGTGWYVRGDLGATTLPNVTPNLSALGSAPNLEVTRSSKLGYTASLGAGYQILPSVRTDLNFDFNEPLKVVSSGSGYSCPQSYKQGAQIGTTTTTSTSGTSTATNGSSMTISNGQNASTTNASTQDAGTSASTSNSTTTVNGVTTTTSSVANGTNASTDANSRTTSGSTSSSNTNGANNANDVTTTTTTSTPVYAYNLVNGSCANQMRATLTRFDVLLNAYYDLVTWHGITPYVGAGVGLSFGHYQSSVSYFNGDGSAYSASLTNPSSGLVSYYNYDRNHSGNYYNFAFALMAGVAFDIFPHTKLDIGYRYLNEGHVLGVNLYEHQARAGLRYMIDN